MSFDRDRFVEDCIVASRERDRMWAFIGLYSGREDNIYWYRTAGRLQAHGAAVLFPGDVAPWQVARGNFIESAYLQRSLAHFRLGERFPRAACPSPTGSRHRTGSQE
jgi:hypothetical protein